MTLRNFMKTMDGDTIALITLVNKYNANYCEYMLYDSAMRVIKEKKLGDMKVKRFGIDYVEQKSYTPYDDCIEVTVFLE